MKRIEKIEIPAKPAIPFTTKQVEVTICDICHNVTRTSTKCSICERDICNDYNSKCRKVDDWDYGDYPNKFCPICHELKFLKYAREHEEIENEHENALYCLEARIRRESLKKS